MEPGPFDYIQTYIDELKRIETLPRRRAYARRLAADIVKKQGVEELRCLVNSVSGYLRRFALSQIELGFNTQIGKVEIPRDYTLGWSFLVHLIIPPLYEHYSDYVVRIIERAAANVDWEVREEAASALKLLNQYFFDLLVIDYDLWACSSNPYHKRAFCVSLTKPLPEEEYKLKKVFNVVKKVIRCSDAYVRKSCGPFGLAHVFMRHPEATFRQLKDWLRRYSHEYPAIWNVVSVFSQANAKRFPNYAALILKDVEQLGLLFRHPKLKRTVEAVRKKVLRYKRAS